MAARLSPGKKNTAVLKTDSCAFMRIMFAFLPEIVYALP